MEALQTAINKLLSEDLACVVLKEGQVCFTSSEKGIKPLVQLLLKDQACLKGAAVADKVIGRAAASLLVQSGVAACYGKTMSEGGKALLDKAGIVFQYKDLVPHIQNREGNDLCPMEKMVKEAPDAKAASDILIEFFKDKI